MEKYVQAFLTAGAYKASSIAVSNIPFNRVFREACEKNTCGNLGRNWMCPPDVGDIDTLIQTAQHFPTAVIYQTVNNIEDSYDIEGMLEAGKKHNDLAQRINQLMSAESFKHRLHLGAGGCRVCAKCAKRTNEPCRHPSDAMPSMEAYGISVYELTLRCNMQYINGKNTVTYFGAYFYEE